MLIERVVVAADIRHVFSFWVKCTVVYLSISTSIEPATHNTFPDVIVELALMQPHPDHPEKERSSGTPPVDQ
jgi:hypothetical protein